MADQPEQHEKTEDPTQKRLNDALSKGDVPKSQEVTSWFILLSALLTIGVFGGSISFEIATSMATLFEKAHVFRLEGGEIIDLLEAIFYSVVMAIALPIAIMMVVAVIGNLVQHPPILTPEPIKPKLEKVSPLAGFKRLFSSQSLVNFAKSLFKFIFVGAIISIMIWYERDTFDVLMMIDPIMQLVFVQEISIKILIAVLAFLGILAAIDFTYQRYQWFEKQKMSLKEIKDEMKQTDGDPYVKARIRQVRMERARKRMMAAVPEATVVITNPTHYAIALRYDDGMLAPVCVAKGIDTVALKIRGVAQENDIPIVENPPLARALYAGVDLDDQVPPEHYKAVAQVIGYVMQLKQRRIWQ